MSMHKILRPLSMFAGFLLLGAAFLTNTAVAQETIDATAQGTSTQLGKNTSIKLIITSYSTPEDKKVIDDAFAKGQNQGLVDALQKMKSVGRIQIPGTLGYDLAYVRSTPTPTGRKIRFVTNRKIAIREAAQNTPSQAYNLTAGEIDINDPDKDKSAGVLYPAAQLIINTDGDLQLALRKNPWQLTNIIDWKPKGKE